MEQPEQEWIYATSLNNRARYVLGTQGERPLLCVGVNPSTGQPGELNGTLKSVRRMAQLHGFDSWLMVNLYPQRTVDPNKLDRRCNREYHQQNLACIRELLETHRPTIWAAWGTLIEKRPYLLSCLRDLYQVSEAYPWVTIGPTSKRGHPHHPLYLRSDAPLEPFPMADYLASLG